VNCGEGKVTEEETEIKESRNHKTVLNAVVQIHGY